MEVELNEMRLLRLPAVQQLTGLSRSTIYQLSAVGDFPAPVKIGSRASAWISLEVSDWIEARISQARNRSPIQAGREAAR
jgi:prophage regulatory protein